MIETIRHSAQFFAFFDYNSLFDCLCPSSSFAFYIVVAFLLRFSTFMILIVCLINRVYNKQLLTYTHFSILFYTFYSVLHQLTCFAKRKISLRFVQVVRSVCFQHIP